MIDITKFLSKNKNKVADEEGLDATSNAIHECGSADNDTLEQQHERNLVNVFQKSTREYGSAQAKMEELHSIIQHEEMFKKSLGNDNIQQCKQVRTTFDAFCGDFPDTNSNPDDKEEKAAVHFAAFGRLFNDINEEWKHPLSDSSRKSIEGVQNRYQEASIYSKTLLAKIQKSIEDRDDLEVTYGSFESKFKLREAKINDYMKFEERIRSDYSMFRDLIREENTLIQSRMTSFSSLSAFLWAAIGLTLSQLKGNKAKKLTFLGFIFMVCVVGILVSWSTMIAVRDAKDAIGVAVLDWKKCKASYYQALGNKFEYIGPEVIGLEKGSGPRYRSMQAFIAVIFISLWFLVLVADIVLFFLILGDFVSFEDSDAEGSS